MAMREKDLKTISPQSTPSRLPEESMNVKPLAITQEIFQIGGNQPISPEDAAIYFINFPGHVTLVDASCGNGQDRLLSNIQAC
jgi:hypothetical protein